MVFKRPLRSFRQAMMYIVPQRLTLNLPDRPCIKAWLWWNYFSTKEHETSSFKGDGRPYPRNE